MDEELKLRITYFFDYWRTRHTFISKLDLIEHRHEANILLWTALDALSNLWKNSIGKSECKRDNKRIIFDAFLAHYGRDVFQLVSLPDVWWRVEKGNTSRGEKDEKKLPENVSVFLSTIGQRCTPDFMEERQTRSTSNDLTMNHIINQILANHPQTICSDLKQWLTLSRYGALAYKEMRNPYIHEGRPGNRTHDFKLYGWAETPTYVSSIYGTPPIMSFSVEFMLGVLKRCLEKFEAEALAFQVDPAPD
jgi:hypothetical protein